MAVIQSPAGFSDLWSWRAFSCVIALRTLIQLISAQTMQNLLLILALQPDCVVHLADPCTARSYSFGPVCPPRNCW